MRSVTVHWPMNILLVDDHALIREALRAVVAEVANEARLLEARDCLSARAQSESGDDIHLAILDIDLPDGNGLVQEVQPIDRKSVV